MNYIKTKPIGLDFYIQNHQTGLYEKLKSVWGLNETDMDFYGRSYRNALEDGLTPEVYKGKNEYESVLWDDRKKAIAFYGIKGDRTIEGAKVTTQAYLIFMCNVDKLLASTERKDEEIRIEVSKQCLYTFAGFEMTGMSTDADIVFKDYSGYKTVKGMRFQDQHPYHYFRINFSINYPVFTNNQ